MTRLVVPASADVVCSQCELVAVTKRQAEQLCVAWAALEDLRIELRRLTDQIDATVPITTAGRSDHA